MSEPLLRVENLRTQFGRRDPLVAVDGISYDLRAGETLGIVGESGAGKSVSVRSLVGLIDDGEVAGSVEWRGEELVGAKPRELRAVRGSGIGMVFQNAEAAFDPIETVGRQIVEAVRANRDLSKRDARTEAIDLLEEVGIGDPAGRFDDYPHEYSGGMAQRAGIAMALAGEPDLLIADEPTTGLDVSVQAGIVDLFRDLVAERDMSLLLISHDLGVVSQLCERIMVMYAGRIVERGSRKQLLDSPRHPYTGAFLRSVPDVDVRKDLEPIGGSPPSLDDPPAGCRFHPRCPAAEAGVCDGAAPPTVSFEDGGEDAERHEATCHGYTDAHPGGDAFDREAVEWIEPADGAERGER
ncbi:MULTISPECIES: ABC transporter ATP-binding protein [Halolamina]|uniref:Nickel import system ATP-binding protein NikD n=1 Tax=Halolamina pelagica TaxID=699431 RepID=A0A1I5QA27_9EURY|nr:MULTISPECIES: ABC transporter ATP-binding protein [Halolamina]NHX35172.1 ABC transporter ATP-binding protein [Halolamina sp. R1-12]SFP43158.1 peptide/nickel transport system ATP-binding protein [Halolamina pelagica]